MTKGSAKARGPAKKTTTRQKAASSGAAGTGRGRAAAGKLHAVILAGGIGSRFWPLSRETTPKQLLKMVGDESLLESTITRLAPLVPPGRVSIVTNEDQAELTRIHLSYGSKGLKPEFIIEPFGRNTAPAIGLAALRLFERDPEAVMAVLPADHVIGRVKAFRDSLKAAADVARTGRLVTFGIRPTAPETGYGYIKSRPGSSSTAGGFELIEVDRFVEKPDVRRARRYLKDGNYFWNSGIFVWKASRILEEIERHLPGVHAGLAEISRGGNVVEAYTGMESISVDHGILEKSSDVVVIPAEFTWSDIGTWSSFAEILKSDKDGNVIKGRVVDIGSRDSVIFGSDRLVATIGLEGMILVDTPDATLVCPRERAQDVKDVVGHLKTRDYSERVIHRTVERPWGTYTVLEEGPGYKLKKICVKPGRRLSLQAHHKRSEHWVVTAGVARVQRGEEVIDVAVNQSTYIPKGVRHRLENPGTSPLEIIEVQSGEYVEEDDIVRFEDDFDRN